MTNKRLAPKNRLSFSKERHEALESFCKRNFYWEKKKNGENLQENHSYLKDVKRMFSKHVFAIKIL